ncbi:GroES-like protein [Dentipellis sp. KUC8613]|nr:GroES-like protein [Dentipellis sp. KUC8613]
MSSALPPNQRVIVVQADRTVALETVPLDKPGPGEVLIKNTAVAQNPSDWKAVENGYIAPGKGFGWDFAGRIAALGEGVTNWKIGDRVAGFHFALRATRIAQNAYCEYTLASAAKPLLHTPDNITDEEAATVPLAIFSALQGLHLIADFPKRAPLGGRPLLVWGGSSSVGQYAIQLARIAGYKVITTASPKHHAFVKSLGAAVAIDYRAPDVVEQIIAASGRGGVDFVYDAISENGSIELAARAFRKDGPRKSAVVLPPDLSNLDPTVEYHLVMPCAFLDYDFDLGEEYFPRNKAHVNLALDLIANAADWFKEGRLKPNPVTVRPGGLSGIPAGLEFMKAGKVSGTKLVYRVADTPT